MEKGKSPKQDIKAAYRTAYLVAAFLKGNLTPAEQLELENWVEQSDHNKQFFAELTNNENIDIMLADYNQSDAETYLEKSKEQIQFYRGSRNKKLWVYMAAACFAAAIIVVFLSKPFSATPTQLAHADSTDLQPGNKQAILTTGNGKEIVLRQYTSDTVIDKIAGIGAGAEGLHYDAQPNMETPIEFHTLSVPRKGTYKLKLSDGSLVWLNAESSIRYPTNFTGNERTVTITGEAFFEVVHNSKMPFKVIAGGTSIEDLGTSFNVNAYPDEPVLAASLLEGSIQVKLNVSSTAILKPSQEAIITNGKLVVRSADLEEVLAWKNDEFHFSNAPVASILRQVARWYDTQIVYRDSVSAQLNATIDRNVPVSRLLDLLAKTNEVHFKVEGKKIIVTQ